MAHVYILRCGDGSYYVGSTVDLDLHLHQHAAGTGAEYTKRRLPVRLVFQLQLDRIDEAYALEKRIQGWSRAKREALIEGRFEDLPELSRKAWRGTPVAPASAGRVAREAGVSRPAPRAPRGP